MLRFLYSYNGNAAHFQGEEAGKSSSRRQEKNPTTVFENENSKSLCSSCSSNFLTPFLKGDLPMDKT